MQSENGAFLGLRLLLITEIYLPSANLLGYH